MKIISADKAIESLKDGMTIMVGGFMSNGTPEILMDAIVRKGVKDLTVIGNDGGIPNTGIGKLVAAGLVKKMIASHIGLNPLVGQLMNEGKMEVTLVPQGTLAERIRAGGAGLGGVLTPTGLGTEVAKGKEVINIDGKDFLLERPLRADIAFVRASVADRLGNIMYKGTTRNFNSLIAFAADLVIAAAEQVVDVGGIAPESVATPGILIDYLVEGEA
jgi:acetate CoA/acetoacetate CoA-transferase alpha subunit